MSTTRTGYCSFCLKRTQARLVEESYFTRNLHQCGRCRRKLVECRSCTNFACWDSYELGDREISQRDQWCAEHSGLVAHFEMQQAKIEYPTEWRSVYQRRSWNMRKISALTLASLAGVAVAAPLAMLAGPAIGGIIGAKVLGLSGAAATSAGLALIGGGSLAAGGLGMAGGMLALTVTGSALGGALGAYLCNQYIGDVEGFDIVRIRRGRTPAIITVSGFLTQGADPEATWGQIRMALR